MTGVQTCALPILQLSENPYMQYFIGLDAFVEKPPFDSSLMVHFRKKLGKDIINEINELIARPDISTDDIDDDNSGGEKAKDKESEKKLDEEIKNAGKLILDATCVPADIRYPTDIWLLNKSREALEEIIDVLHRPHIGFSKKPRTYRNCARKEYLNIDKKKRPSAKEIRKGIGKQLRYIQRDLESIENLIEKSSLKLLDRGQYRKLLISNEIYRQQLEMYQNRSHKIDDRYRNWIETNA